MKSTIKLIICVAVLASLSSLGALHFARWNTSLGSFTAELYDDLVPITANNFIDLANSGFYNDLIFHRVIEGFVIQDGCPYGTGYGGPGYTIPDEIHPDLIHDSAGILAMAKTSAPNSAGSQYYITLAPQPNLDGNYAVFGKVVEGLENVMIIGSVPTDANDRPVTPVNIHTLSILDLAIGNITPPTSEYYNCYVDETQMFIIEASSQNLTNDYAWFVDGIEQANTMDFIFEHTFSLPGTHTVSCTVSNSDWSHDVVWDILANGSESVDDVLPVAPILSITPNPTQGITRIALNTPDTGMYKIYVYDLRGRVLSVSPNYQSSDSEWIWDGCDTLGSQVHSGIYLISARSEKNVISKRCVVTK